MDKPLAKILGLDPDAYPDLGRYVVRGLIGEGGMGLVYEGHDKKLDRPVAIKVLQDEQEEGTRERFYREAKLAAALNHPNIIRIIDYSGPELPRQFIVMERLMGKTLQELVERAPLIEVIACVVGHEVARGLSHAHQAGMIHRDVKPENIFVEPDGRVVLIDFGLAKGSRTDGDRATFMASHTQLIGTPLFGSPEQCTGSAQLTDRSDLFSLGSVLYFSTTQVYPFQGDTIEELLDKLENHPPMPIEKLVGVSPEFRSLLEMLMQKRPEDRPQNAEFVSKRLEKLLIAHKVVSATMTLRDWQKPKTTPKRELDADTAIRRVDMTQTTQPTETREVTGSTRIVTINTQRGSTDSLRVKRAPKWPYALAGGIVLAAIAAFFLLITNQKKEEPIPPPPVPDTRLPAPLPVPIPEPPAPVEEQPQPKKKA